MLVKGNFINSFIFKVYPLRQKMKKSKYRSGEQCLVVIAFSSTAFMTQYIIQQFYCSLVKGHNYPFHLIMQICFISRINVSEAAQSLESPLAFSLDPLSARSLGECGRYNTPGKIPLILTPLVTIFKFKRLCFAKAAPRWYGSSTKCR